MVMDESAAFASDTYSDFASQPPGPHARNMNRMMNEALQPLYTATLANTDTSITIPASGAAAV